MAKKRSNGEGSICRRSDGTWQAQATVGFDPATGKSKRKTFYGKTRKEVVDKMQKVLVEFKTGNYIEPTALTIGQWLDDWHQGRKPHISENTHELLGTMIRCHLNPVLGAIRLKDLRTRDIQKLLNEKFSSGRVDGRGGLSPRTVKHIHSALNGALRQAVKERLLLHNPCEGVELPRKVNREMRTFSREDLQLFLAKTKNHPHYPAFLLTIGTGLRRGELLGLRWSDVDFHKGMLSIKQQIVRGRHGLLFGEPKTPKSKRSIALHKELIDVLKAHKKQQNEVRLLLGAAYADHGLVFCREDGMPLDPCQFARQFGAAVKRAGLEKIRFHDLRHSYATLSLEAGVSLKAIQEVLGHTSITMTGDIYGHVTERMRQEAADKIGAVLVGCLEE